MPAQKFGPRRSRAARKPDVTGPEAVFYRCSQCGSLYQRLQEAEKNLPACCGQTMAVLAPLEEIPLEIKLDYKIVGSLNENAVQVFWDESLSGDQPLWFYLKTFTGGIIQYVAEKKRPPMVFPLAGDDAYAYCDKDPCVECTFRCKRGFVLYGYFINTGLVTLPLDRMSGQYRA